MLLVRVSEIPPEGIDVRQALNLEDVHLVGEGSCVLEGGQLDCRIERGDEASIHVRGRLQAKLGLECNRCLEGFSFPMDQNLDLFYLPHLPGVRGEEEEEVQLSDRDVVVAYYAEDRLDLGEMVREQILLALPMKRLCRAECRGLCPLCGTDLNRSSCACAPDEDARLSPLKALFEKGAS